MKTLLDTACERFGKRGLSKRLGISEAAIYLALKENRELRPEPTERIRALLTGEASEMPVNACEPSTIEQMITSEVHRMTQDQQTKVYRYCIELQVKEE